MDNLKGCPQPLAGAATRELCMADSSKATVGIPAVAPAAFATADFAVLTRPPVREGSLAEWLPASLTEPLAFAPDGRSAVHREAGTRVQLVEITALDVSASEIRARLRQGRSVRYLLPEAVREAVIASGAYGTEWRR